MAYATDSPEELLDLVDNDNKVIGTVLRQEVFDKMLDLPGNVRAADCFIVNSDGRIFVPRRSPTKKHHPNALDYSAGEHVESGETYEHAMTRGLREELGLDVNADRLVSLGILNMRQLGAGLPYINTVFMYRSDDIPDYDKNEFVSHEWLTPEELKQRLEAGEPAKLGMLEAVTLLMQTKSKG